MAYNPDQERDEKGRFASGGGGPRMDMITLRALPTSRNRDENRRTSRSMRAVLAVGQRPSPYIYKDDKGVTRRVGADRKRDREYLFGKTRDPMKEMRSANRRAAKMRRMREGDGL